MAEIEQTSGLPQPSADDKNIAVITHLAGIFFSIVPGLLVWILKKDDSAYLSSQTKEALNFQITMLLAYFISSVLVVILIGFLLMGLVWLINLVFCIIAAVETSKGAPYRYPFALRLIS
jgi:uncharacterized protein